MPTIGELKIKLSAETSELDKGINSAKQALMTMEKRSDVTTQKVSQIIDNIADNIIASSPKLASAGSQAFGAIDKNVPAVTEEVLNSVPYIMDKLTVAFAEYDVEFQGVGNNLIKGIGEGISQSSSYLLNMINSLADKVLSQIRSAFQISSPSKKTAYLGQMIGEGLAYGISESVGKIDISQGGMYTASAGGGQGMSSTYNTYNTTYNASQNAIDGVNMADFENRLRRAYA